ncbi:Salivary proline-rich protein II-1, putative, partial [Perkinsus marinus ATCC 50983]
MQVLVNPPLASEGMKLRPLPLIHLGGAICPPLPGAAKDPPPPLPGSAKGAPPPLPGSTKGTPPPLPGAAKGTPPPLPGSAKGTPPPLPGAAKGTPPPLPGAAKGTPPPLPGAAKGTPPPLPGKGTPPPLPGAAKGALPSLPGRSPVYASPPPPSTAAGSPLVLRSPPLASPPPSTPANHRSPPKSGPRTRKAAALPLGKKLHWKAIPDRLIGSTIWASYDEEGSSTPSDDHLGETLARDVAEMKTVFGASGNPDEKKSERKSKLVDDRPKLIEILDQKRAQNAGLVMARLPVELLVEKMENLDTDNMVDASEEEDSSSAALVPSSG